MSTKTKDPNADLFALLKFIGTGSLTETFSIGKRNYGDGRIRVTRPLSSDAEGVRMLELKFTSVSDEPGAKGGRVDLSVVAVDPATVKKYIPSKNINIYVTKAGVKKENDFMHIGGHITKVPASLKALCAEITKQLGHDSEANASDSVIAGTRKHESVLEQIRDCKTSMQDAMESVTELKTYLTSSKFHEDNTVQVRDVLNRLAPIASAILSGLHTLAPAMASEAIAKPSVTPRAKANGAKGAQEDYPETKTWREYMKLYAGKRTEIIAEGDKLLFSLIQRFNGDMLDLHCGNEVELAELQMNAHDLKMHARSKHPEFLPLVTKIVEEYEQYKRDQA